MAEYSVGDKVILKDDGQVYTVAGVRTEDRIVLFDLEKGDERALVKLTVLRSQIEIQKVYAPKQPRVVIYKKIIFIFILSAFFYQNVHAQESFKHIPMEYIVTDGDPQASSGVGAEHWGVWHQDPGPRGCLLDNYAQLKTTGVAPAQWKYDAKDWWLEEHGAIMEKPEFPLPAGRYVVTGGREATAVLTIYPQDKSGASRWELNNGAKLYDVTHLPCHAARYRPQAKNASCSPEGVNKSIFPVAAGVSMPAVQHCDKKDYSVLFVVGVGE